MSSNPAKDYLFCSIDGEDMDKTDVGLDDSSKLKTTVNDDDLDKQGVPSQVKTKTKTKTRPRPQ